MLPEADLSIELAERLRRLVLALSLLIVLLLACLGGAALVAAFYLFPAFVSLFEGMNLVLPLPTKILIGTTKWFQSPVGALLSLATLGVLTAALAASGLALYRRARSNPVGVLEVQAGAICGLVVLGIVGAVVSYGALLHPFLVLIRELR